MSLPTLDHRLVRVRHRSRGPARGRSRCIMGTALRWLVRRRLRGGGCILHRRGRRRWLVFTRRRSDHSVTSLTPRLGLPRRRLRLLLRRLDRLRRRRRRRLCRPRRRLGRLGRLRRLRRCCRLRVVRLFRTGRDVVTTVPGAHRPGWSVGGARRAKLQRHHAEELWR